MTGREAARASRELGAQAGIRGFGLRDILRPPPTTPREPNHLEGILVGSGRRRPLGRRRGRFQVVPGPRGVTFLSCGPSPLINGTEAEEGKRKPPRSARGEAGPFEARGPRRTKYAPGALLHPGVARVKAGKAAARAEQPTLGAAQGSPAPAGVEPLSPGRDPQRVVPRGAPRRRGDRGSAPGLEALASRVVAVDRVLPDRVKVGAGLGAASAGVPLPIFLSPRA